MSRPSWDEYFMEIANLAKTRSTCLRRQVGAVLTKEKNILATGYNGAPAGVRHCEETGCLRNQLNIPSGENHELCRGVHAEQNAIVQAAKWGTSINGATLYSTVLPCFICAKMIINAGIVRIVIAEPYADKKSSERKITYSEEMIKEAGIELVFIYDTGGDNP